MYHRQNDIIRRATHFLLLALALVCAIPQTVFAQGLIDLGVNPKTELQEFQVDIPGLVGGATPLVLVQIPPGKFTMGSPLREEREFYTAWWPHEVAISRTLYVGRTEVTRAQYKAVMGSHRSKYRSGHDCAAERVSWYDAGFFCNQLSRAAGLDPVYDVTDWSVDLHAGGFRLPTDAEWEWFCRAGTTARYWFGDGKETRFQDVMWCNENKDPEGPKPVGSKPANPWGLYDVHGNVAEYCLDWWEEPRPRGPQTDPAGPPTGFAKTLRGGQWSSFPSECAAANRTWHPPYSIENHIGFRVVASLAAGRDSDAGTSPNRLPAESFGIYTIDSRSEEIGLIPKRPLISLNDIASFNRDACAIELNATGIEKFRKVFSGVSGVPFAVCVDRAPIYRGHFYSGISSFSCDSVVVMQRHVPTGQRVLEFQLGYPGPDVFTGQDKRLDPRILEVFNRAGKLK